MDMDCDDQNVCTTDTCNTQTGMCSNVKTVPDGTLLGYVDMVQDCKTEKCVGGMEQTVALDTDVPTSGNPCVTNSCSMQMVLMSWTSTPARAAGGGNQICDGMGNCVGCVKSRRLHGPRARRKSVTCNATSMCVDSNDAPGTTCRGGGGAKVCDNNGNCVPWVQASDCTGNPSDICTNNQCMSSCGDGMKDGNETGKDCGGPCPKCGDGQGCASGNDCTSGCTAATAPAPLPPTATPAPETPLQCLTGSTCVGNICCNTACNTTCQACVMTLTGLADGTCGK